MSDPSTWYTTSSKVPCSYRKSQSHSRTLGILTGKGMLGPSSNLECASFGASSKSIAVLPVPMRPNSHPLVPVPLVFTMPFIPTCSRHCPSNQLSLPAIHHRSCRYHFFPLPPQSANCQSLPPQLPLGPLSLSLPILLADCCFCCYCACDRNK